MMRTRLLFTICLLLASCTSGQSNSANSGQPVSSRFRVSVTAEYGSTFRGSIVLRFRNEEAFPVCFSADDLVPGYSMTMVRDLSGRILNGSLDYALESFRGVNVVGGLVVLRPGKSHSQALELAEYHPEQRPLLIQVGFQAFRCSEMFDGGQDDIGTAPIQTVFRFAEGRIVEEPGRHFEMSEEPPPADNASR